MADSMRVVAGAEEAEQTPQGVEQILGKGKEPDQQPSVSAGGTDEGWSEARDKQRPSGTPASSAGAPDGAPTSSDASKSGAEPAGGEPAPAETQEAPETPGAQQQSSPGFGERGRMRRRARFLRKARELAYRDLGGLVFDLHRFGQRNDQLVLAKLAALRHIDAELRALEEALNDRRPVVVLREVGIAACPRCAAIHGSDDRFCPGCGLAFDAHADRPISTAPVSSHTARPTAPSRPATPLGVQPQPIQSHLTQSPQAPRAQPAKAQPATQANPSAGPATPAGSRARPVPASKPLEEDKPTQVLRPPASGK